MPNWDHRCPDCGGNGSYLDFSPATKRKAETRLKCPWCGHVADAEAFYEQGYYA